MLKDKLVGCWRLLSFTLERGEGAALYPFGADAVGLLIYDSSTRMSVQIMRRERPMLCALLTDKAAALQHKGSSDEALAAFDGYLAYAGSYETDENAGAVLHRVECSLLPNWIGLTMMRYAVCEGDRLILSTPALPVGGDQYVARLVWERIRGKEG
jgi:hypothetical protein